MDFAVLFHAVGDLLTSRISAVIFAITTVTLLGVTEYYNPGFVSLTIQPVSGPFLQIGSTLSSKLHNISAASAASAISNTSETTAPTGLLDTLCVMESIGKLNLTGLVDAFELMKATATCTAAQLTEILSTDNTAHLTPNVPRMTSRVFVQFIEHINVTCHITENNITTDLIILEDDIIPLTFCQVFWLTFSLSNITAVAHEIIRLYDVFWDAIPTKVFPFAWLTMYILATWQLWCIGCALTQYLVRAIFRAINNSSATGDFKGGDESDPDDDPTTLPLPESRKSSRSASPEVDSTIESNSESESDPTSKPEDEDKVKGLALGSLRVIATFWRITARKYLQMFQKAELDLEIEKRTKKTPKPPQHSQREKELQAEVQRWKTRNADLLRQITNLERKDSVGSSQQNRIPALENQIHDLKAAITRTEIDRQAMEARWQSSVDEISQLKENANAAQGSRKGMRIDAGTMITPELLSAPPQVCNMQRLTFSTIKSISDSPFTNTSKKYLGESVVSEVSDVSDATATQPISDQTIQTEVGTQSGPLNLPEEANSTLVLPPEADVENKKVITGEIVSSAEGDHTTGSSTSAVSTVPGDVAAGRLYARQQYERAFPHGFDLLPTSPEDFLCGLNAVIHSIEATLPGTRPPTLEDLQTISRMEAYKTTFWLVAAIGEAIDRWFIPEQLDYILRHWAYQRGFRLRLGYVTDEGKQAQPSVVSARGDRYNEGIVWVYLDRRGQGHWFGIKPKQMSIGIEPGQDDPAVAVTKAGVANNALAAPASQKGAVQAGAGSGTAPESEDILATIEGDQDDDEESNEADDERGPAKRSKRTPKRRSFSASASELKASFDTLNKEIDAFLQEPSQAATGMFQFTAGTGQAGAQNSGRRASQPVLTSTFTVQGTQTKSAPTSPFIFTGTPTGASPTWPTPPVPFSFSMSTQEASVLPISTRTVDRRKSMGTDTVEEEGTGTADEDVEMSDSLPTEAYDSDEEMTDG